MNTPAWDGYFRITDDARNVAYQWRAWTHQVVVTMMKMANRSGYDIPDPLAEEEWEFLLSVFALGKVRTSETGQYWLPLLKAHVYRGPVAVITDSGGFFTETPWTVGNHRQLGQPRQA